MKWDDRFILLFFVQACAWTASIHDTLSNAAKPTSFLSWEFHGTETPLSIFGKDTKSKFMSALVTRVAFPFSRALFARSVTNIKVMCDSFGLS